MTCLAFRTNTAGIHHRAGADTSADIEFADTRSDGDDFERDVETS
jgi:hypothetical protein